MTKDQIAAILKLVVYLESNEGKTAVTALKMWFDESAPVGRAWLEKQPGVPSTAQQRLAPLVEAFAAAGVHVAEGDFADFWAAQDAAKRHRNRNHAEADDNGSVFVGRDPEWDALCEQHGRKDGPDVGDMT